MIKWLERAKETQQFHIDHLREDPYWRLSDTCMALNRSMGSISEDLLIMQWYKTHKEEMEKFVNAASVLYFIRQQKRLKKINEL